MAIAYTTYVAMAVREYGQGRICIHTDNIGAYQTGHQKNPHIFWRGIFEWTASKTSRETIRVGIVISDDRSPLNRIETFRPISVEVITVGDISLDRIGQYDLLYFVGLPDFVPDEVANNIKDFVDEGGGVVVETPDRGSENINVLSSIEDVLCYSAERPLETLAYWTLDGNEHDIYTDDIKIVFMTTLRANDFSSEWSILMNSVPSTVATTTLPLELTFDFNQSSVLEFGVGFISAMQNGIVELETGEESSSSSNSSSSSSSSSIDSSSSSSSSSNSSSLSSSSSQSSSSSSSSQSSSSSSSSQSSSSSSSQSSSSSSSSQSSSSSSSQSSSSSSSGAAGIGFMVIEGGADPFKVS